MQLFDKIINGYKYVLFRLKIKSVSRITLDWQLKRLFKRLDRGIVLDIGSMKSPYKNYIPYTKYMRMDIDSYSKPDVIADIHNINWESDFFDAVIATEVLEHTHTPSKAIKELWKVLKKNGICLLSTRFIYPYHPSPNDYYRFTEDSLKDLFKDFTTVEVYSHGNRFLSIWQLILGPDREINLITVFLSYLNPIVALFNTKKSIMPLGYVVWAKK